MDIFCVGMYRSGSTWQYHVASELVAGSGGKRLGFVAGDQYRARRLIWPESHRVLKSHDAHRAFARSLESGRARAVYSIRDMRDVAFSLMHKWRIGFDEMIAPGGLLSLCLENDRFWSALPNVLTQRYRKILAEPVPSISEIAEHLRRPVALSEAESISLRFSFESNRARVESLEVRLRAEGIDLDSPRNALRHDPNNLLHWNHLRSGRIGTWRDEATHDQARALADVCGDWLIDRGYVVDHSWVDEVARRDRAAPSEQVEANVA